MYFAGIDIGSVGSKSVILEDDKIASYYIGESGPDSIATAWQTFQGSADKLGLKIEDIDYVVATGYGRVLVPYAKANISEISCHARGAHWMMPSVRTILDMGGQDCKAINCDEDGVVTKFVMNDKCAGGTGRFLETIAEVLGLALEEIGPLSLESNNDFTFSTICAVFAKSEAVGLLKKGVAKADILAGLNVAIAARSYSLLKRMDIQEDFAITGGIAKNPGMVAKITELVGMGPVSLKPDPQVAGALGAALFARERYLKEKGSTDAG